MTTSSGVMNLNINGGEVTEPRLIEVPSYDEDLDEAFTGPFSNELSESYDDMYEVESTAIIEGRDITDPLTSAVVPSRGVSADTQLGAVPGSSMLQLQQGLTGYRDLTPEEENLTQATNAEFASSEEDGLAGRLEGLHDFTNPDGSPLAEETSLLNELQQVQRDIANRRKERMQRQRMLSQQLVAARQELQHEVD